MIITSIINLKGGVAKTTSSINLAYALAATHGFRVLLIDNDKQGNSSMFFDVYDNDRPCIADVLLNPGDDMRDAIQATGFANLDILPANLSLLQANKAILIDTDMPQMERLKMAIQNAALDYDYVIIDNPPDLDMAVNNALVVSDHVLIPIKIDKYTFDGVVLLLDRISTIRYYNDKLKVLGAFVTMYQKTRVNIDGYEMLQDNAFLPVFNTVIRKTTSVDVTTFEGVPVVKQYPGSTAAQDYIAFTNEYLSRIS